MGICGAVGIHYRRKGGCTRRGDGELSDDLVNRCFDPAGPDRLWCLDITEHPTDEGKVYCAVVLDCWSRRVIGWSIADHIRAELVADAVQMAVWRRRPPEGQTIAHADHGSQFTSSDAPPSRFVSSCSFRVPESPRDASAVAPSVAAPPSAVASLPAWPPFFGAFSSADPLGAPPG